MPLPLIPVVVALVAAGCTGVAFGVDGAARMSKADAKVKKYKARYRKAHRDFQREEARIQESARAYGTRQLEAQSMTLGAWLTWLEANERKVRTLDRTYVDGVKVVVPDIRGLRVDVVEASGLLKGGVSAVVAGVAAQQAALFGVRSLAVAGTGAAISGLSGAAAEGATLAWLGGGTLAAGGAGVAGGAAVLTGIAIAPALLIGGLTLSSHGDKALTKARRYQSQVKITCAEMTTRIELFHALRRRIKEIRRTLKSLERLALASLVELETVEFDPAVHAELFQRTALLMRAVGEILSTPLLDAEGNLSDASTTIIEKYAA